MIGVKNDVSKMAMGANRFYSNNCTNGKSCKLLIVKGFFCFTPMLHFRGQGEGVTESGWGCLWSKIYIYTYIYI